MAGQRLFIAIARISNNPITKEVIGYRLAQVDSELAKVEIKDVPTNSVKQAITNRVMKIENIAIVSGEITGTQGSLDRLPLIKLNGGLLDTSTNRLTIAYEIGDVGYRVVAWNGMDKKLRTEEILTLINENKYSGLSNAKVVDRDGMQFISAINGEFKQVALKKVKSSKITSQDLFEDRKDQVVLKKSVDLANSQAREEIDFNDTFRLLTEPQRKCIETYYTWWTTMVFNSLTKNSNDRLKANPRKMQALADLRGKDIEWRYGGCVPASILIENRKLNRSYDYCQLGHKIYYVHKARGVDSEGNVYLIKFGSQCSQDFFDISPEGLRKLIKVSDAMKEEIEFICNNLRDKKVDEEWQSLPFMTQLVDRVYTLNGKDASSTAEQLKCLFGDKYPVFLVSFRLNNIPFPKSLLELCREYVAQEFRVEYKPADRLSRVKNNKLIEFYRNINNIAVKSTEVKKALDLYSQSNFMHTYSRGVWQTLPNYFEFLIESKLEGKYGYDPSNKVGKRGKGRFTQESVYNFERNLKTYEGVGFRNHDFNDLMYAFDMYKVYIKLGEILVNRLEEHTKVFLTKYKKTKDYVEKDVYEEILDNIEYEIRTTPNDNMENIELSFILQSLIISSIPVIHSRAYLTYSSYNLPRVRNYYEYKNVDGFVPVKCTNINRLLDMYNRHKAQVDEIILKSMERKLQQCEDAYQLELEIEKQKREMEYRKSIVCSNENCKFNCESDGSCNYIIEHGLSPDFVVDEHDYVTKCNKFIDKDPEQAEKAERKKEYKIREEKGQLDRVVQIANLYYDLDFLGETYNPIRQIILSSHDVVKCIFNMDINTDEDVSDHKVLEKIDKVIDDIARRIKILGWEVDELTGHIKWLNTRRVTGYTDPAEKLPLILNRTKEPLDMLGIYRMVMGNSETAKYFGDSFNDVENAYLYSIRYNDEIKTVRDLEKIKTVSYGEKLVADMKKILMELAIGLAGSYMYFDVERNTYTSYIYLQNKYGNLLETWMIPNDKLDTMYNKFREIVVNRPSYNGVFSSLKAILDRCESSTGDIIENKKQALVKCAGVIQDKSLVTIDIDSGIIMGKKTDLLDEYDQFERLTKAVQDAGKTQILELKSVRVANSLKSDKEFTARGDAVGIGFKKVLRIAMLDILNELKKDEQYFSYAYGKVYELKKEEKKAEKLEQAEQVEKAENIVIKEVKTDLLQLYKDITEALAEVGFSRKSSNTVIIADDIAGRTKYKDDSNLSFKQLKVIKTAIEHDFKEMNEKGFIFNFDTKKFEQSTDRVKVSVESNCGTSTTSSESSSNSEENASNNEVNWQKKLDDDPKIKAEVDQLLQAIASGDSRLTTKIANIAFSVKKYGKVSMKQYKYIKEGIEKLK